jgi:hypothetical protein
VSECVCVWHPICNFMYHKYNENSLCMSLLHNSCSLSCLVPKVLLCFYVDKERQSLVSVKITDSFKHQKSICIFFFIRDWYHASGSSLNSWSSQNITCCYGTQRLTTRKLAVRSRCIVHDFPQSFRPSVPKWNNPEQYGSVRLEDLAMIGKGNVLWRW